VRTVDCFDFPAARGWQGKAAFPCPRARSSARTLSELLFLLSQVVRDPAKSRPTPRGWRPPAFPYDTRTKRRSEGTLSTGWPTEHRRRRRSQHRGLSCEGERPGAEAVS